MTRGVVNRDAQFEVQWVVGMIRHRNRRPNDDSRTSSVILAVHLPLYSWIGSGLKYSK